MARFKILNAFAVPAAGPFTSDLVTIGEAGDLTAVFDFDYGSGGTSLRLWLQTSFDGGTNWYDIISPSQFATTDAVEIYSVSSAGDLLTAPTEGSKALAAATVQSGMIGDMLRVAGTVVGTYAASTLTVIVEARQDAGGTGALDAASLSALENIGLNAGENHIGEVGGKTTVIKPTITVDTGIYAANDVLGALVVSGVVTLTGAVRISGGTGVLESVSVFDDDNEKNPITLLFFDSAPASGTYVGNGALSLSTGDKAKYIGRVNISAADYETQGGDAFACIKGIGLAVQASGSANLYMIPMVTSGTPTYTASTDIQMVLGFLAD